MRVPSGSDDHWLARVKAQAETFEAERDALAAQHTALLGRGRAHVASLVEFARTAPTQEAEYEATMTARLIEHIIGDADEGGCGPCAALAVDGAGQEGRQAVDAGHGDCFETCQGHRPPEETT